jgi:hypothetical protein
MDNEEFLTESKSAGAKKEWSPLIVYSTMLSVLHTTGNSVPRLIKNYNTQRISKEVLAGVELYSVIFLQMLS